MRRFSALAFTLALMAGLMPSASSPAVARPDGATTVDESFSHQADIFDEGGWGITSTTDGHIGPGARVEINTGEHWGASGHWTFAEREVAEPEELYWRYWVRFDEGNDYPAPARGKLPGPAGLYTYNCLGSRPSTEAEPCWSARMMFSRDYVPWGEPGYPYGEDGVTAIGFYVYHLDQEQDFGDVWQWNRDVAVLDNGDWYCLEGHIALNTPGSADGELQGWVDGQQAFDRTGMRFRRASEPDIDIKSFWFDIYYGGSMTSPQFNGMTFDSLAFGPERVGCDDSNGPFYDDDGSIFEPDIEWLAAQGITLGCNPPTNDRFCPDAPVTRGQMAAFLSRALDLPAASGNSFADDNGSNFEADIEKMAAAGITLGCEPGLFCPNETVTRGQMAAFLVRAYGFAGSGIDFSDDDGSIFEAQIEALASAGVTLGCADGLYCPFESVTRDQMAAFLHRASEA